MLNVFTENNATSSAPPFTVKKRATAEEIQSDLKERIERAVARDGRLNGCEAPMPRLSRVRSEGGPNWTVDGFPGLPDGCFGAIVRIVDQARMEYELIS